MTEERLTEKQEAFLGKNASAIDTKGMTKDAAKILIGDIINQMNKDKPANDHENYTPSHSEAFASDMNSKEAEKVYEKHARPVDKPKTNGNVFKLTEESIRSNALSSAIEWIYKSDTMAQSDLIKLAKEFEGYIRHGN